MEGACVGCLNDKEENVPEEERFVGNEIRLVMGDRAFVLCRSLEGIKNFKK